MMPDAIIEMNRFACAALQGILASEGGKASDATDKKEEKVKAAFDFADLMFEESKKRYYPKTYNRSPDPF